MSDHYSHASEPLLVDPAVAARANYTQAGPTYQGSKQPELTGVAATLAERGKRYGDFTDHATICQDIKRAMRGIDGCATNWEGLTNAQRQALEVIADKIARILSGDPEYKDNWHDIQGYAKLAEDRCKGQA